MNEQANKEPRMTKTSQMSDTNNIYDHHVPYEISPLEKED